MISRHSFLVVAIAATAVGRPPALAWTLGTKEAAQIPLRWNLVAKFSSDSLLLPNGASVMSWTDSTNGIVAGTAIGIVPTFQTAQINGKPSVRCGGSGGLSIATPGPLASAIDSQVYTVFIVFKTISGGGPGSLNTMFGVGGGTNGIAFTADGTNVQVFPAGSGFDGIPYSGQTEFSTLGFISGGMNSIGLGNSLQEVNEGAVTSSNANGPPSGGGTFAFCALVGNAFVNWTGDLFEVLVFNTALTPAQYKELGMWARDKYGQPHPMDSTNKLLVLWGDSISAGIGTTSLKHTPCYLTAQTLSLSYGQFDCLGVPSITLNQMNTMSPTWIDPIAAQIGKKVALVSWEWANQQDSTTDAGITYLANRKAVPNLLTVWGTSTNASLYDKSKPRALFDSAWDVIWAGSKTNIDSYMPIHLDPHIGVNGSYATFSRGGDGLHLTDTTYPFLAAIYVTGYRALP